jgi:hypothetical protein
MGVYHHRGYDVIGIHRGEGDSKSSGFIKQFIM